MTLEGNTIAHIELTKLNFALFHRPDLLLIYQVSIQLLYKKLTDAGQFSTYSIKVHFFKGES